MKQSLICPKCKLRFEAREWQDEHCPRCGLGFSWFEQHPYYGAQGDWDIWVDIEWDSFEEQKES